MNQAVRVLSFLVRREFRRAVGRPALGLTRGWLYVGVAGSGLEVSGEVGEVELEAVGVVLPLVLTALRRGKRTCPGGHVRRSPPTVSATRRQPRPVHRT